MRSRTLLTSFALLFVCAALLAIDRPAARAEHDRPGDDPGDWFAMQRAYPLGAIDPAKVQEAVAQAQADRDAQALSTTAGTATWQQLGPYNIGGRVTALAVSPSGFTVYLGSANGGVFKSTDAGVNWTPIFDGQAGTAFSIGALAFDPSNLNKVYVGTGEANASVDSYDGYGLYRTVDGGQTWSWLGLSATARIARVAVDPQDSARIFVAAMGTQFSTGPDRGLYRSEDYGKTWTKVLYVSDSTGVCDVVLNPAHPETLYCATWERVRHYTYRRAFGPECGVWRSVDHGTTWTRLTTGLPAPSDDVGRIGLALARTQPSTLVAQIIGGANLGYQGLGIYKTTDAGNTWAPVDVSGWGDFGGFGWYFGDCAIDPNDPNTIYSCGMNLTKSTDGGVSWTTIGGINSHTDFHAIWIDPGNPNHLYVGDDGGFFTTTSGGGSWTHASTLPISQFYAGCVDPANAAHVMGGTQDNSTMFSFGGVSSWTTVIGGDGFQCVIDPTNSNIEFGEYQYCCMGSGPQRTTNGWATGGIPPSGFNGSDRYNWNTPIVMDPRNHNILLAGSQRVYKSTNNGVSYAAISGDLTNNLPSGVVFHTISTLDVSPVNDSYYYAGTDDGRVWTSTTAGASWTDIGAGLPVRSITRVVADPVTAGTVYVTLSGFGQDEHLPHVFMSTDNGAHWTSISGNLPDAPANDIVVDPAHPATLYLATDVGVYVSRDLGNYWYPFGVGMPMQTVFDMFLHAPSRTLYAATHGRSMWKLDLTTVPTAVPPRPVAGLALSAPAPNPSRGNVALRFTLPRAGSADVAVFDALGRRIRTLAHGALPAGTRTLAWDGADERGAHAAAGVYFVQARAGDARITRRLVRAE